jgi:hypothetical protein
MTRGEFEKALKARATILLMDDDSFESAAQLDREVLIAKALIKACDEIQQSQRWTPDLSEFGWLLADWHRVEAELDEALR